MKKIICAVFLLICFVSSVSWASPWGIDANSFDLTIHTIDLGTGTPTVYGPFLSGQLGSSGDLRDVAVIPDGHYALVSNYGGDTVYRVDLADPTNPVVAGSLDVGLHAADIAVSPNGLYALVTDGNLPNIAVIDLSTFSLVTVYALQTAGAVARAVAIAADNQTVIVCDTPSNRIIYGAVDPTNLAAVFPSEATLSTGNTPVNVTISPDGQTALVANLGDTTVSVFQITAPGAISAGTTPTVSGLPGGEQSIAFSPNGQRAYVASLGSSPDKISWLQINSPGNVELGGAGVANLPTDEIGGFAGTDIMGITPSGSYALVGNFVPGGTNNDVALVNLSTWAVTAIDTNSNSPAGLDIIRQQYGVTIPTLTEWGVVILFLLTMSAGLSLIRRRRLPT